MADGGQGGGADPQQTGSPDAPGSFASCQRIDVPVVRITLVG